MESRTLPPLAATHVLAPDACLRCGVAAEGDRRVAVWEEEEKGRLGARPAVLCAACHEGFFAGAFGRVEVARWYHAAKGSTPHAWIDRIDRDRLLDVVCLECGVLLDFAGEPAEVRCLQCDAINVRRRRGQGWTSACVG